MKVLSSSALTQGFSVIEIVLALALLMVVVTGALSAQFMSEYWLITSRVSSEALGLNNEAMGAIQQLAMSDFYMVSSTERRTIESASNPILESCRAGGLCYQVKQDVLDVSLCSKQVTNTVVWKVSDRYPTSSVQSDSLVVNIPDEIARGGDCVVSPWTASWGTTTPIRTVSTATSPVLVTGVDTLGDLVYVVASSAPMLRIYKYSTTSLLLLATSTVAGNRLNAIDVITDIASGRRYAYIVQHTTNNQLVVVDVSDVTPVVLAFRSLAGSDPAGSFPQGWRVVAYGNRLYVTTRETAGAELHIFSITDPSNPIEISSGAINLARTVNDFTVQERLVGGALRRYLVLAASAALKELAIFEVTHDTPVERVALDLPGTENALSLTVLGDTVYLGRQQSASGPELYQFSVSALLSGATAPLARSEVGADVSTVRGIGDWLFLGTTKLGAELQVWQTLPLRWSPLVVNAARLTSVSQPRLASLGFDIGNQSLMTVTQSGTLPEQLSVWSVP